MKQPGPNMRLFIVFAIALTTTVFVILFNRHPRALSCSVPMEEAAVLAQQWFDVIEEVKKEKGIRSDSHSNVPNVSMIGNDWSDITTTLGSLEAKETASNPDFAALVVRLLHEADIVQGDTVGLILSGSFPSISISVLAALQTLEIDAVLMSSLGSSTYGANQDGATWLDMEKWLRQRGGLTYQSRVVSIGAGQDHGNGLTEEGMAIIRMAAERNATELYLPQSLISSIQHKTELLLNHNIDLLINVGGNMAALGSCSHTLNIPNGLNSGMNTCSDNMRGIIPLISEQGIPFIHFLNIKELALKYGMDVAPGSHYAPSRNLYRTTTPNLAVSLLILLCSLFPIAFLRRE